MFSPDRSPAQFIDHTLLSPTVTTEQIVQLCEDAVEYGFASVCVPPQFVPEAVNGLYGSEIAVCTVVGFPCGYNSTSQKVAETADLVAAGASEIDMVMQIGHLLSGRCDMVKDDIAQVVVAAKGAKVKVIIECCYLSAEQKRQAAELVIDSGAAFVKTSTGFGPGGATIADVELLKLVVGDRIKIKAAGGIRSLQDCETFIAAGANRIGTSSGVALMKEWHARYV